MDINEIKDYIASVRWQFAKTMPKHPHSYTLKKWNPDKIDIFEKFVIFIRENGYEEKYLGQKYFYFDVEGYQYWTMGAPLEKTILINRAKRGKNDKKNNT